MEKSQNHEGDKCQLRGLEKSSNPQPNCHGQSRETTGYVLLRRAHEFILPGRQILCSVFFKFHLISHSIESNYFV